MSKRKLGYDRLTKRTRRGDESELFGIKDSRVALAFWRARQGQFPTSDQRVRLRDRYIGRSNRD